MKVKSTATLLALVTALSIPQFASATSKNAMTMLNGANQMNSEQQDAATMLREQSRRQPSNDHLGGYDERQR